MGSSPVDVQCVQQTQSAVPFARSAVSQSGWSASSASAQLES